MHLRRESRPQAGVWVALIGAGLLALVVPINGSDTGVVPPEGCLCHSDRASAAVVVAVDGWPAVYTPNEAYPLTVTATGDVPGVHGGFSTEVSKGSLSSADPAAAASGRFATHTSSAARTWPLLWTAPPEDSGGVTLVVYVNLVDGDGGEGPADHWNLGTFSAIEKAPEPPKPSYLNLSFESERGVPVAGRNFTIVATLKNFTEAPIRNAAISFSEHVAFGVLQIGESRTDANGTARLNLTVVSAGDFLIMASYGGSSKNESSTANATVVTHDPDQVFEQYYGRPSRTLTGPFDPVRVPLALIVGGVWLTFAFAMRQVLGARKVGAPASDGVRDLFRLVFSRSGPKE